MLNSGRRLHNSALQGLVEADAVFFDKNPTGRMINRFSKETLIMDDLLLTIFIDFINTSLTLLGNFVVFSIVAPPNIAIFGCFVLYIVFMIYKVVPISKDLRRIELITKSPILSLCNSSILGLVTIRSLNLEKKFINEMHSAVSLSLRSSISYRVVLRFYQGYIELAATLVNVLNVTILILLKDSISSNLGAMSISLVTSMSNLVAFWARTIVETNDFMASPQRLMEYSVIPREGDFENSSSFEIVKGKIEVKNLYVRYREDFPYALKNLNFTLEAGEKVGIIGRTGAGKSTIMQVLFRLTNPCSGTIYIDGQDYLKAGLHQLRKQMSVIPQSPTIFSSSLRDNLDPFHEHSDDTILNIINKTRLSGLIASYPGGLNSMLIGNGGSLSAGQKQLLCLARALIRKNKIVMMDEATANVDPETDIFIQSCVKDMLSTSTLLIVAHRLRTIIDADKVIVMDEGTCKESGTPYELGNNPNSLFRKLIMHTGPQESQYLLRKLVKSELRFDNPKSSF